MTLFSGMIMCWYRQEAGQLLLQQHAHVMALGMMFYMRKTVIAHRATSLCGSYVRGWGAHGHIAVPECTMLPHLILLCIRSGVPCILWDHMFDWGADLTKTIRTLIDIRRRSGIVANSQVDIKCAEGDLYVAVVNDRYVAIINNTHHG